MQNRVSFRYSLLPVYSTFVFFASDLWAFLHTKKFLYPLCKFVAVFDCEVDLGRL